VSSPNIHPEARVDPLARVHPTSRVGAGAVIEANAVVGPQCVIGAGTRLRTGSVIVEHTTLGEGNDVHPTCVLGGDPQDRAFTGEIRGELIIGDRNIFREGVTFNRGTGNGPPTRVGSGCMFMAASHAGHNCQIGDNCTFANGALLAGHVRMGAGVVMAGGTAVHQFTNIGDGVMFQGGAMVGMHVPPYMVLTGVNRIAGINRVGLRRNPAMAPRDREEIKELYKAVFRHRGAAPLLALAEELLAKRDWGLAGTTFLRFIVDALNEKPPRARGVCGARVRPGDAQAGDAD